MKNFVLNLEKKAKLFDICSFKVKINKFWKFEKVMSEIIEINFRKQKLKISSNTKKLKTAKLKISKNLFINYLISDFKWKINIGISTRIYEFLFLPAW